MFGGFLFGSERTAEVQRYDVATGTWSDTAIPDMPEAVSGARAVLGADDRVYVIAGENAAGPRADVYALDLHTNTWSVAPCLATARRDFAAAIDVAGSGS